MSPCRWSLTVCIHDLRQARAALTAGHEAGFDVALVTAPHSARYAGVGYWRAVELEIGRAILTDCGDLSGIVMAGLRCGLTQFVFSGDNAVLAKLDAMARQSQGRVLPNVPEPCLVLEARMHQRAVAHAVVALVERPTLL